MQVIRPMAQNRLDGGAVVWHDPLVGHLGRERLRCHDLANRRARRILTLARRAQRAYSQYPNSNHRVSPFVQMG